jgi:hypothetical protein
MNRIERIKWPLTLLAMTSDEQLQYIKELGTYPLIDELALEFDDVYRLFEFIEETDEFELLPSQALSGLKEIDLALDKLSDPEELFSWYEDGLLDPRWDAIRSQARSILEILESTSTSK